MQISALPHAFERHRRLLLALILAATAFSLLVFEPVVERYDYIPLIDESAEALETLGLALIIIAIAGRAWCTLYIGGRKSRELVTAGPYSISRNPLYLFSTIGATGAGAISESAVIMVLAALVCLAASWLLITAEENRLREIFGSEFDRYAARVPRLWPDFGNYRDGGEVTFTPRNLVTTVRDGLVFLAAYPIFEGIETLHEWEVLPVLFTLY